MKKNICTLRNITKQYSNQPPTPHNISLAIYADEVLGVRGNNGTGKSTLLGIIAGLIKPDFGERITDEASFEKIAFVPQELSLYESLSGAENLKFWGLALGMSSERIRIRTKWLLDQLDLTDKANSPVSSYSGGMKRRLHLATALMQTPKILLLDEPTVGSDSFSVQCILQMILHLKAQGTSIVLTSHQSGELESVSDRILDLNKNEITEVIHDGRIKSGNL